MRSVVLVVTLSLIVIGSVPDASAHATKCGTFGGAAPCCICRTGGAHAHCEGDNVSGYAGCKASGFGVMCILDDTPCGPEFSLNNLDTPWVRIVDRACLKGDKGSLVGQVSAPHASVR
jgi:hypothetical protein